MKTSSWWWEPGSGRCGSGNPGIGKFLEMPLEATTAGSSPCSPREALEAGRTRLLWCHHCALGQRQPPTPHYLLQRRESQFWWWLASPAPRVLGLQWQRNTHGVARKAEMCRLTAGGRAGDLRLRCQRGGSSWGLVSEASGDLPTSPHLRLHLHLICSACIVGSASQFPSL